MKLQIDIHPDMIGSPTEIGELVEKQMLAEANGKKKSPFEIVQDIDNMIFKSIKELKY